MKICPRCKAITFDDMDICYGCMYHFAAQPQPSDDSLLDEILDTPQIAEASEKKMGQQADHTPRGGQSQPSLRSGQLLLRNRIEQLPFAKAASALVEVRERGKPPRLIMVREGERLAIGRSIACDIALAAPNVSRKHAELSVEGGALWIADLDSTNGTRAKGRYVVARESLQRGDTFQIGDAAFAVVMVDEGG